MPLPEPSEQEGESVKAGQEPSPESPEPGTDVVPAAPTKPMEFSELVLLTASTENGDGVDSQPKAVHCVLSLEMSGPDTLPGTPQILPVEEQQGAVQPSPQAQELKHSKPDTGGPEFLRTPLGGSFLVYESFLYRREKAAGEKVYWTCRDQARMGCRSRAITQGKRVTVMRGHCHPPDLGGLEALRQREKRPGTAQRGSSGGPEFLRTPLGGSFLVYESFLYRREKAAGEKVYWTCRDQARMRCRSRAITQGQRVMVMRRHCHPPDLGGLEALRQREQLPSPAQREGSETLQPLEFLRTSLGGRFLVYESFLYRKEKAAGEKVYWMCRDQARMGCRSRAITQGQRVTIMRSHCHLPDLAGLEALRQRERLPSTAQQEDPGRWKIHIWTASPNEASLLPDSAEEPHVSPASRMLQVHTEPRHFPPG
uniref:FLYWCH-type zinc finger-containing protein 1 n=1 Tax=Phocoena sinus TaxID=42100 RepID=A0A8C9E7X1_PHOSS